MASDVVALVTDGTDMVNNEVTGSRRDVILDSVGSEVQVVVVCRACSRQTFYSNFITFL